VRTIKRIKMFVLATLVITLLIVIYKFLIWQYDYFEKLGVPAPKPRILLGNIPNLLLGKRHIIYDYDEIYQ
jgi:cytochrome P450 family 28